MVGPNSIPPSATVRTPVSSVSGGLSLSRNPEAPARSAAYT